MALIQAWRDLSPDRAKELFARYQQAGSFTKVKTVGPKTLYRSRDRTRHLLWVVEPGGRVTLEEHDARCDC